MTVYNQTNVPIGTAKLFFDESGPVGTQRYEHAKYPILERILENQMANYWRPTEISLQKDAADFKKFSLAEEHVYTSNLRRQIVLDSVQGRAPAICYGPYVSDPVAEAFIYAWTFFETIHSQSYTHIIRNLYANPSVVFDKMGEIREIVECGVDVSKYYDELTECQGLPWGHIDTKRAFYRSMVSTNALEQIRFHLSFASTFSFANRKKVEGSGRIVSLIRQDESYHCGFTQNALKIIVKEDPDFAKIAKEEQGTVESIYKAVHKQELEWIDYLFIKGPILGLTKEELTMYLNYLVAKRMQSMDVTPDFEVPKKEPLVWMRKFLNEDGDDQPAPQEEELTSYQTGNIDLKVEDDELITDF